jgi:hypothetical protein
MLVLNNTALDAHAELGVERSTGRAGARPRAANRLLITPRLIANGRSDLDALDTCSRRNSRDHRSRGAEFDGVGRADGDEPDVGEKIGRHGMPRNIVDRASVVQRAVENLGGARMRGA